AVVAGLDMMPGQIPDPSLAAGSLPSLGPLAGISATTLTDQLKLADFRQLGTMLSPLHFLGRLGKRPLAIKTEMDEDEERRKRRREKNKVAAARCRNKKKERTDFLQRESERLEMVNSELKAQIEELRLERQQLMVMLNLHRPTCIVRTDSVKTPESEANPLLEQLSADANCYFNHLYVKGTNGNSRVRLETTLRKHTNVNMVQVTLSGSGAVMDQCEDEESVVQERTSDQPVTRNQDRENKGHPSQDQEDAIDDECDTDLEIGKTTNRSRSLSPTKLYLRACQQTGATPVSSFLRHLGEANLNLNHYGVGPLGAKTLAIVLQSDNVVTSLELEDNALQAEGTRYLMEMLKSNSSIQSLNLSNNQLHLEGADLVSKMLLDNYYIKCLKLSGNNFDDSAAKYLAEVLKGDYVVKELDLSHNKFCTAGGEHLGHMLASNVGIEVLNLSWNHLRMSGAMALSAGLKVNSTLKELYLSCNGFGQIEAQSLGQALKQNSTLVLLDLSSNHIDDQAVSLLCQGLATNSTLRVLKLCHNPLMYTGALTLLQTVKNNTKSAVVQIDISTVFVCEAFMELLEDARQSRPALDIRYSVMHSVTRNISALQIFQKFLKERNESIMDFFQALDKEETMKVSTSAFRNAVKLP
ncbi:hypothetical protein L3Q82_011126, partial [Scortum barcoo]